MQDCYPECNTSSTYISSVWQKQFDNILTYAEDVYVSGKHSFWSEWLTLAPFFNRIDISSILACSSVANVSGVLRNSSVLLTDAPDSMRILAIPAASWVFSPPSSDIFLISTWREFSPSSFSKLTSRPCLRSSSSISLRTLMFCFKKIHSVDKKPSQSGSSSLAPSLSKISVFCKLPCRRANSREFTSILNLIISSLISAQKGKNSCVKCTVII